MENKILGLMGLMRRAGALEPGEQNSCSAVKGGKAKLLLLADDASDNARRRAETFVYGRNVVTVQLPVTKEELGAAVGSGSSAMAAVTDLGFANALMKALRLEDAEKYSAAADEVAERFAKAERRKGTSKAQESNRKTGKGRTNI